MDYNGHRMIKKMKLISTFTYREEKRLGSDAPICISHDLPRGWYKGNCWGDLSALHVLQVSCSQGRDLITDNAHE